MSHPNPRHTITGRPIKYKKHTKKDVSAGLEPATLDPPLYQLSYFHDLLTFVHDQRHVTLGRRANVTHVMGRLVGRPATSKVLVDVRVLSFVVASF